MRMTREEFLECYEKIYICNEKDKREALEFLDSLGGGKCFKCNSRRIVGFDRRYVRIY